MTMLAFEIRRVAERRVASARERRPLSPFCCSSNSYPSNTCISSTPVAHLGNDPSRLSLSVFLPPLFARHPLPDCERSSRRTRERLAHEGVVVEEGRKATSTSGEKKREYNKLQPRAEKQQDNGRIGGLYGI